MCRLGGCRRASSLIHIARCACKYCGANRCYETGCISVASVNGSSVTRDSRHVGQRGGSMRSIMPGIHCAISVRFPCDFSKVSTHTVREDRMRCKAKAHDLCALTIRSDCRARFMCSHYTCEILGFTVANSRETISNRSFKNKPNIFLWFIIINSIYYQLFITNKWATYL